MRPAARSPGRRCRPIEASGFDHSGGHALSRGLLRLEENENLPELGSVGEEKRVPDHLVLGRVHAKIENLPRASVELQGPAGFLEGRLAAHPPKIVERTG